MMVPETKAAGPGLEAGARSLLVVDDDALFLGALSRMIVRLGIEPTCAESVDEAATLLAAKSFDAVLLDIEFPRQSGIVLLKHLQLRAARSPPVIVMSGAGSIDDVIEVLRRGAVDYLRKPFPPEELSAAIDRAFARRDRCSGAAQAPGDPPEPPPRADAPPDVNRLIRERIDALCATAGLSAREREVLDLVLLGRSLAEIGTALEITPRTAKFHLSNVLAKLGAESRADLVRIFL